MHYVHIYNDEDGRTRLEDRQTPMLRVWDHIAHIEVVRHDLGMIDQHEAELEQILCGGVDSAEEHPLVADIAESNLEQLARDAADEGGDLLGVVDVRVQREVDPLRHRLARQPLESFQHAVLQEMLRQSGHPLARQPDIPDVRDIDQRTHERLKAGNGEIGDGHR